MKSLSKGSPTSGTSMGSSTESLDSEMLERLIEKHKTKMSSEEKANKNQTKETVAPPSKKQEAKPNLWWLKNSSKPPPTSTQKQGAKTWIKPTPVKPTVNTPKKSVPTAPFQSKLTTRIPSDSTTPSKPTETTKRGVEIDKKTEVKPRETKDGTLDEYSDTFTSLSDDDLTRDNETTGLKTDASDYSFGVSNVRFATTLMSESGGESRDQSKRLDKIDMKLDLIPDVDKRPDEPQQKNIQSILDEISAKSESSSGEITLTPEDALKAVVMSGKDEPTRSIAEIMRDVDILENGRKDAIATSIEPAVRQTLLKKGSKVPQEVIDMASGDSVAVNYNYDNQTDRAAGQSSQKDCDDYVMDTHGKNIETSIGAIVKRIEIITGPANAVSAMEKQREVRPVPAARRSSVCGRLEGIDEMSPTERGRRTSPIPERRRARSPTTILGSRKPRTDDELTAEIEMLQSRHEREIAELCLTHGREVNALKHENCMLLAKVKDLEDRNRVLRSARGLPGTDEPPGERERGGRAGNEITRLKCELEQLERLVQGYQKENEKVSSELKLTQTKLYATESKLCDENVRLAGELAKARERARDLEITRFSNYIPDSQNRSVEEQTALQNDLQMAKSKESHMASEIKHLKQLIDSLTEELAKKPQPQAHSTPAGLKKVDSREQAVQTTPYAKPRPAFDRSKRRPVSMYGRSRNTLEKRTPDKETSRAPLRPTGTTGTGNRLRGTNPLSFKPELISATGNEEMNALMQMYEADISRLNKEINNLKNKISDLENERTTRTGDRVEFSGSETSLYNMSDDDLQKRQLELQVQRLQLELQAQATKYERKLDESRGKTKAELEKAMAAERKELTNKELAVRQSASHHIGALTGKIKSQDIVIDHLKDKLTDTQVEARSIPDIKRKLAEIEQENRELKRKINDLESAGGPESRHLRSLKDKVADLERRHEQREMELKHLMEDANLSLNQEIEKYKQQVVNKNQEIIRFRRELDQIMDAMMQLREQGVPVNIAHDRYFADTTSDYLHSTYRSNSR